MIRFLRLLQKVMRIFSCMRNGKGLKSNNVSDHRFSVFSFIALASMGWIRLLGQAAGSRLPQPNFSSRGCC